MIKKITVVASLLFSFGIAQAQDGKPELLTPADAETAVSVMPTFSWDTLPMIDSFVLQVSLYNTVDSPLVYRKTILDSTYAHTMTTKLNYSTLYYWRVMSYDSLGLKVDSSDMFSFTTNIAPPAAPENVSPMSASIDVGLYPSLSWTSVASTDQYRVVVSTYDNFSDTAFSAIVTSANTSVNVNVRLNSYTVYYWRVAAENAGGIGDWSGFWNFTTLVSSVKEVEGNFRMHAYPNPTIDQMTVSFETETSGHAVLTVTDLSGKVVSTLANENLEAGKHEFSLGKQNLSSGVYLVKLAHAGQVQTLKVVMQ